MRCVKLVCVVFMFIIILKLIDVKYTHNPKQTKTVRFVEPFVNKTNEINETNKFIIDTVLNNGDNFDTPKENVFTRDDIDNYRNKQFDFRNKIYNTSHGVDVVDRINQAPEQSIGTTAKSFVKLLLTGIRV